LAGTLPVNEFCPCAVATLGGPEAVPLALAVLVDEEAPGGGPGATCARAEAVPSGNRTARTTNRTRRWRFRESPVLLFCSALDEIQAPGDSMLSQSILPKPSKLRPLLRSCGSVPRLS
jgi:hypothetical protein